MRRTGTVGTWLRSRRPVRQDLRADAVASLPGAISSVPDGMAASVLAGVNPIYGLYASFAGPIAGGLTSSTRLMVIAPTSAAALAAGSALAGLPPADRPAALFLLTLLAGVAMVLAGLFRLGRYVRFVSHSVMIGFLTGVAANIILGQLPDLTGVAAQGEVALTKALDVLSHPQDIDLPSLVTGLSALALLVLLARTRLAQARALIALVLPTVVLLLAGNGSVQLVEDVGDIPQGIPLPHLPDLTALSTSVVTGALSVALIVLVQGAGVAESAPNPGGARSDANVDFAAQGFGNIASSLVRGLPVGGSVGNTALNVSAGARSRWASILSGAWMLVILAIFSGAVGKVAMPALAALLIYAAVSSIRSSQISMIARTGTVSRLAASTTFVATLFLPIQAAVGIGVVLSLLLQLNAEAMDLTVVELVPQPDGTVREQPAPATLSSNHVTALDVHGSLLYAGSRTLQSRLPDPQGTQKPVVVLRLRGRPALGATFFVVVSGYADRLASVGGRLYLSGVETGLREQMVRAGQVDVTGPVRIFPATETLGESTRAAYQDAEAWLVTSDVTPAGEERPHA
jgi:SulP family sulfate permease